MKDEGDEDEDEDEGYAGNHRGEVRGVMEGCWYSTYTRATPLPSFWRATASPQKDDVRVHNGGRKLLRDIHYHVITSSPFLRFTYKGSPYPDAIGNYNTPSYSREALASTQSYSSSFFVCFKGHAKKLTCLHSPFIARKPLYVIAAPR